MVDDRAQLGDPQRLPLQIAFDVFRERGEWPSYQYVDRQLHREGIPSADVLASLPLELTQFDRYHPQQTSIALTVAGLAAIEDAHAELDLFLRAVRWLVRREAEYEPPSPTEPGRITLTSTEFLHDEGLELTRLELAKILELLRVEWLTAGSGGPSDEDPIWQVTVDEKIRPYDGVANVGEYLVVKRRLLEEASQQAPRLRPIDVAASSSDEVRAEPASGPADPHQVFVVYGRNEAARVAMFELLRALGLHPLEWRELRAATGKPSPYIGEILDAGFTMSQACVVLMTPDEAVRLRDEFIDEPLEQLVAHQPRPNVLLEMGMALYKYRDRTVLVELGRMRQVSDLGGIHALRMNNSMEKRRELAERLRDAECEIRMEGTAWQTAGNFDEAIGDDPPTSRIPTVDTEAERAPNVAGLARRLEAQLEDAHDTIGEAMSGGRLWPADQHLPLALWGQHEEAFARLGRETDKPVRDAFRKLSRLDDEAQRRAAAEEAVVGTVTVGPTLALTEEDHKRLHDLQGVVRHAMSVLRAMPT